MEAIRINLLGGLDVLVDARPVFVGMPQTKPVELFAYLLIHRRRTHSREILATLLWPDATPGQARKNLRKVLYTLQHFLTDVIGSDMPSLLVSEQDWVGINPTIKLELDVAIFEQAFVRSQQKAGATLDIQTAQEISDAVQLYKGELLPGLYTDWCLHERERLENLYLEMLHTLMLHSEAEHAYEQAITYGLEILHQDRANERTHYDLMRLYYYSGNRTAALHQYEHCVAALMSELGVKPSKSSRLLYEQICQDDPALTSIGPDSEYQQHRAVGTHTHLHQVREDLQAILERVQDEIHRVEHLLQT